MKTCLVLLLNPFVNDSRVLKECISLSESGYRVVVFALHDTGLPEREDTNFGIVLRFKSRKVGANKVLKLMKFGEIAMKMLATVSQYRPDVIHANDLETLPIGWVMARQTGAKLIYDSHELWRDPGHRQGIPVWMFESAMAVERFLAPRADGVITVSESIAQDMEEHLRIRRPTLVRNVPMPQSEGAVEQRSDRNPLREDLGLSSDVPVVLYQGRIADGYGVRVLLEAFQWVERPAVLVYMGFGPLKETLQARVNELGLSDRVYFHDAVPPQVLLQYSAGATVGACPSQGTCTSYRYSLPNKFFEYIQAGLPVVTSDLPELKGLVARYAIGRTFKDEDARDLADTLNAVLADADQLERYRQNVQAAAAELHWNNEEKQLIQLYHNVCSVS